MVDKTNKEMLVMWNKDTLSWKIVEHDLENHTYITRDEYRVELDNPADRDSFGKISDEILTDIADYQDCGWQVKIMY